MSDLRVDTGLDIYGIEMECFASAIPTCKTINTCTCVLLQSVHVNIYGMYVLIGFVALQLVHDTILRCQV